MITTVHQWQAPALLSGAVRSNKISLVAATVTIILLLSSHLVVAQYTVTPAIAARQDNKITNVQPVQD